MQHPTAGPTNREFTTFMRAYQDMVFSTAARMTGNDAQAQDIAQDVFVKAYENFSHLRSSDSAGGWLRTVATNLTLNYLTRYRKRRLLFSELKTADDGGTEAPQPDIELPDSLLASLSADERGAALRRALERLPQHQRLALVLYHFEDFSYEQIAARLNASLAKIKTDIRRARLALLPLLKSQGIEP